MPPPRRRSAGGGAVLPAGAGRGASGVADGEAAWLAFVSLTASFRQTNVCSHQTRHSISVHRPICKSSPRSGRRRIVSN